ncbi:MAG: hypothetical protein ACYCQI_07105 [Gammaproteobacteria bacterium]
MLTRPKTDTLKTAAQNLKNALLELGKTYIPSVHVSPRDTWTTYIHYYGLSYERTVNRMMDNPEWLPMEIEEMDKYLVSCKDPKEIEGFKEKLAAQIRSGYYPKHTDFIKDRENLASQIEPLINAVKNAYAIYLKEQAAEKQLATPEREEPTSFTLLEQLRSPTPLFATKDDKVTPTLIRQELVTCKP